MNVSISTRDDELKIKYGMYDLGVEREGARHSLKYILTDLTDIKQCYIRLGFHLIEFDRCKYYEDFGYLTFAEFCAENIPLDKSAISRCMAVCNNFCIKDTPFSSPKMFIDSRYSEYNYSQLCEMVSLKDDERRKITPDMSVKQIREIKKKNKKTSCKCEDATDNVTKNVIETVPSVATSQRGETRLCVSDLVNKKGIVLQNHIKKCSVDDDIQITLYDADGKMIFQGRCGLLMSGSTGSGSGSGKTVYYRVLNE